MELPHSPRNATGRLGGAVRPGGFARSLLAYELPDGRLKLIGHLRRDIDPDMEVEVEVLDVNEEEARTLLLSIDPLAELAEAQEQLRGRLMELAPADSEELRAAWQAAAEGALKEEKERRSFDSIPEQFLLLVTCRDEQQQVELLQRFHNEGIQVKALIS